MTKEKTQLLDLLPAQEVYGNPNGKSLWALIIVDEAEPEDTQTELWRADHHDQLANLAHEHWAREHNNDPALMKQFEDAWGVTILPTKIGRLDKGPVKKK